MFFRVAAYLCCYYFYYLCWYFSDYGVVSVHHVGILCENLERSLDFYQNILGMPAFKTNIFSLYLLDNKKHVNN